MITNVTGTMSNGNTITIDGNSLMNQSTTGWDSFFTADSNRWSFEGTSSTGDGYTDLSIDSTPNGTVTRGYSTARKLFGSKSYLARCAQTAGSYPDPVGDQIGGASYYTCNKRQSGGADVTFYTRLYGYWENNGGNWTDILKWIFFQSFTAYEPVLFQPKNGGGSVPTQWTIKDQRHTNGFAGVNVGSGIAAFAVGKWHCVELQMTHSATVANQYLRVWVNNQSIHEVPVSDAGWTDEGRHDAMEFGIINTWHSSGNYDVNCYNDGLAMGTQRINPACIIELADNSVYASATKRWQFPVAISDSQVQFVYDDTGLSGGSRYVFVTDNQGNRSSGFQVV